MSKSKLTILIDDQLRSEVEAYCFSHGKISLSQAVNELVSSGLAISRDDVYALGLEKVIRAEIDPLLRYISDNFAFMAEDALQSAVERAWGAQLDMNEKIDCALAAHAVTQTMLSTSTEETAKDRYQIIVQGVEPALALGDET